MKPKQESSKTAKGIKRVTLQDIADMAGVHKMVVSNALNNTGRVAPATRTRIQEIARELNYIPNFAARALTNGSTKIIAVLSGPTNEPYYGAMIQLLKNQLGAQGFHLMLMETSEEVRELADATGNVAVDGVIAIDMIRLVDELRSHPTIPCVSIGTCKQAFVDNVYVDLSASVEEGIGLMLAAGRHRIAYLVTTESMADEAEARAGAYLKMMRENGRAEEIINLKTDQFFAQEDHFRSYIEANGCPDALLCQNDDTAMCAFEVLRELDYQIPRDVLLLGCDGQRQTKYLTPPLSTIVQPMEKSCAVAWQLLQNRIANPDLPHQQATIEGTLLVRESLDGS